MTSIAVHALAGAANDYASLTYVDRDALGTIPPPSAEPLGPAWCSPAVRWDRESDLPIGDFCELSGHPVLSARAIEALGALLDGCGDLHALDIADDEGGHRLLDLTRAPDLLDTERSEVKRYSDGRIMRVKAFAFRPGVEDETLFRLPELMGTMMLATEPLVARAEQADVTGMRLAEVWSPEAGSIPIGRRW